LAILCASVHNILFSEAIEEPGVPAGMMRAENADRLALAQRVSIETSSTSNAGAISSSRADVACHGRKLGAVST
jgi:hypothetical protein